MVFEFQWIILKYILIETVVLIFGVFIQKNLGPIQDRLLSKIGILK